MRGKAGLWIVGGLMAVTLVAVAAYPVIAGGEKASGSCSAGKVSRVSSCPTESGAAMVAEKRQCSGPACEADSGQVVASVDEASCGTKDRNVVAGVNEASCGTKGSCLAGKAGTILLSVDADAEGKAGGKHARCDSCVAAKKSDAAVLCAACTDKVLQASLAQVQEARKAVEAGNQDQALKALAAARKALSEAHARAATVAAKAHGHHDRHHDNSTAADKKSETDYVNSTCPMMGRAIRAHAVKHVREYQGKKVAFCCGGCPEAWDHLSDEQKAARLSKAK